MEVAAASAASVAVAVVVVFVGGFSGAGMPLAPGLLPGDEVSVLVIHLDCTNGRWRLCFFSLHMRRETSTR